MQQRSLPPWVPPLLAVVAAALVPWTLWLTFTLPGRHVTSHYRDAWVGFDIALLLAFAATAGAALRVSRWLPIAAAVTATLLACDAWFDVVTAGSGDERALAALEAVVGELPLAALCVWIAWDVQSAGESRVFRFARRFRRDGVEHRARGRTPA